MRNGIRENEVGNWEVFYRGEMVARVYDEKTADFLFEEHMNRDLIELFKTIDNARQVAHRLRKKIYEAQNAYLGV